MIATKKITLAFALLLATASLQAQTTEPDAATRIEQNSGGQVTIEAPKALLNRINSDDNKSSKTKTEAKSETKSVDESETERTEENNSEEQHQQHKKISDQSIVNRSVGFRIQVYSDNNFRTAKSAAQNRAKAIAMKFPTYRSYLSYKAPAWRLRIGDFKSQSEAAKVLAQIKHAFPAYASEMTIVRDKINVWQ